MKTNILLLLTLAAATATAQDLTHEITVEREIEPLEREAHRMSVLPTVSLPALSQPRLQYSTRGVAVGVTPSTAFLAPVTRTDSLNTKWQRGYVAAALGAPLFNADLAAGYRIISTASTDLSAWLQYATTNYGRAYKGTDGKHYYRRHNVTAGVNFDHRFTDNSFLQADLSYMFGRSKYNTLTSLPEYHPFWANANAVGLNTDWTNRSGNLDYGVDMAYNYFGFNTPVYGGDSDGDARQHHFHLGGFAAFEASDHIVARLNLGADMQQVPDYDAVGGIMPNKLAGIIDITPTLRYTYRDFSIEAGPRFNISWNAGKVFHIAALAHLSYTPTELPLAVSANVGGGEMPNLLGQLYAVMPGLNPWQRFGVSHMPLMVDADITLGPWRGAWLRLYGGWAKVNDWYMPYLDDAITATTLFEQNINGTHLGIELGGKYRNIVSARAGYEYTPGNKYTHGWYLNRDRARHTLNANVTVKPLTPLTLTLNYQLRAQRRMAMYLAGDYTLVGLHNVSLLDLSADYLLTPRFSVGISANNLLNANYTTLDLSAAPGINLLLGATYRF